MKISAGVAIECCMQNGKLHVQDSSEVLDAVQYTVLLRSGFDCRPPLSSNTFPPLWQEIPSLFCVAA